MNLPYKTKKGKSVAACLILFILLLTVLLVTPCDLFASEIYLQTFNVDMTLEKDGTLVVTEKSEAVFTSQDTTWWNFYRVIDDKRIYANAVIDPSSFRMDGRAVEFSSMPLDLDSRPSEDWKREYKGKTLAYFNYGDSGLELCFILPEFVSGRHTFEYTYEVKDYLTGGADAAIFYHKYLSEINGMDVKGMNVTLHFPRRNPRSKLGSTSRRMPLARGLSRMTISPLSSMRRISRRESMSRAGSSSINRITRFLPWIPR